jgi:bacterioferritin-associated ferredoxin
LGRFFSAFSLEFFQKALKNFSSRSPALLIHRSDGVARAMIVCSCNVISDRDIRACAKPCGAAADRARDVFRSLGCAPKCGRCVRNIQTLLDPDAPWLSIVRNETLLASAG